MVDRGRDDAFAEWMLPRHLPVGDLRLTERGVTQISSGLRTLSWARDGEVDHGEGLKRRAT
jgi:hypothetical protein